jgi:hypothetical protein
VLDPLLDPLLEPPELEPLVLVPASPPDPLLVLAPLLVDPPLEVEPPSPDAFAPFDPPEDPQRSESKPRPTNDTARSSDRLFIEVRLSDVRMRCVRAAALRANEASVQFRGKGDSCQPPTLDWLHG